MVVAIVSQVTSEDVLDAYSQVVVGVAERLGPSVANLRVGRRGSGSGVVITPDGFMLTNAHVVGNATRVTASFTSGATTSASVVGIDPPSDLGADPRAGRRPGPRHARGRGHAARRASWWSRSATRTG